LSLNEREPSTPSPVRGFEVDADNFGLGIPDQIVQVVDLVKIEFVAHAHNLCDADIGTGEEVEIGYRYAPALGQYGNLSFAQVLFSQTAKGTIKPFSALTNPIPLGRRFGFPTSGQS